MCRSGRILLQSVSPGCPIYPMYAHVTPPVCIGCRGCLPVVLEYTWDVPEMESDGVRDDEVEMWC